MADIYSKQGITQTPTATIGGMSTSSEVKQSAKIFDAIQDNFEKKAKEHQALAEKLYENGSNIAITQGLNELSRNPKYASNPEAFALEADKMAEKIYAQIDDPNMKLEVATNYELKKNPYINRAYDNMYRQQQQQQQFQTIQNVEQNLDSLSMSFSNLMDNTYSVDDFRTLKEADDSIQRALNAKDSRGFDLLSPSQKNAILNQKKRLFQHSAINAINRTPLMERIKLVEDIANDKFEIINAIKETNGEEEIGVGGLNSYLTPDAVQYVKAYSRGVLEKYMKQKDKIGDDGVAMDVAITQQANKNMFQENNWEKKKGKNSFKGDIYDMFRYRNELIGSYQNGGLSDKDYKSLVSETIPVLLNQVEELKPKSVRWINDSFSVAIKQLGDNLKLTNQNDEVKAYAYTMLYNNFEKAGINPKDNFPDYDKVAECVNKTTKDYLTNQNPDLLGVKAQKVLTGTALIDFDKKEPAKVVSGKNYVLKKDPETGTIWKVFKDKDGNYSDNSARMRVRK